VSSSKIGALMTAAIALQCGGYSEVLPMKRAEREPPCQLVQPACGSLDIYPSPTAETAVALFEGSPFDEVVFSEFPPAGSGRHSRIRSKGLRIDAWTSTEHSPYWLRHHEDGALVRVVGASQKGLLVQSWTDPSKETDVRCDEVQGSTCTGGAPDSKDSCADPIPWETRRETPLLAGPDPEHAASLAMLPKNSQGFLVLGKTRRYLSLKTVSLRPANGIQLWGREDDFAPQDKGCP
jgi:hypothetical protein